MAWDKQWYKAWFNSPYYSLLYLHHHNREISEFLDKLVNYLHIPAGARVLDMACGSGLHAREMADRGFEVTGLDLSERHIAAALQEGERPNLSFGIHDMRQPYRSNYYDLVLSLFTSFGYFATRRENDHALRTLALALKPSGILVLDYLNSVYVRDHLVRDEVQVVRGIEFSLHREYDPVYRVFLKEIQIRDPLTKDRESFTERVMAFTRKDFEGRMADEGLEIQELFGDYHFNGFSEAWSPRLIILAKKR